MYPRSGVAAVIIHDENLLVVKKRDEKGIMYSFPTGGQEPGETLVQAVQREVLEEVGCEIVVGPLLWVRGSKCEEWAGFQAKSEHLAQRVSSTAINCLRNCSTSSFIHQYLVNWHETS